MRPLIVAATFDAATQDSLDALRRRLFPPERNRLAAHLTLFHALPGDAAGEVLDAVRRACGRPAPAASITGVRSLGRGAALVVDSPELARVRAALAAAFAGRLTRQDAQGFRAHVTVQNFVDPAVARATVADLSADFPPGRPARPATITGLAVHHYDGGPWELLEEVPFAATS